MHTSKSSSLYLYPCKDLNEIFSIQDVVFYRNKSKNRNNDINNLKSISNYLKKKYGKKREKMK